MEKTQPGGETLMRNEYTMFTASNDSMYHNYLNALLKHYGTITLPISTKEHHAPLDTVFQPLRLLREPSASATDDDDPRSKVITANDDFEAFSKSSQQRIMVLGAPGMGKTTLLKHLLHKAILRAFVDGEAPAPIFISLPDLARSQLSLQAYLPRILTTLHSDPAFASELARAIDNGQVLLCLDGLDEVLPAQRPALITMLNETVIHCGGSWIIGSRYSEYKGAQFAPGSFAVWELQPLDWEARAQFANQLLASSAQMLQRTPVAPEQFMEELKREYRLAIWSANPLFLTLLAIAYVQHGTLPTSKATLFGSVFDIIATQTYTFKHQMVQEYLAAVALARQLCSEDEQESKAAWEFAWNKHTYSRWFEILCMLVGVLLQEHGDRGMQIATQWLQRLGDKRQSDDGDIGNLALNLALKSLHELPLKPLSPQLETCAQNLLLVWARQLTTDENMPIPEDDSMSMEISMFDLHFAIPLIRFLEEHRTKLPELSFTFDLTTVPARVLEVAYQHTRGISLRNALQTAIVQQHAAQEAIIALLLDKNEPWRVREYAVTMLGKWQQPATADILITIMLDTSNFYRIRIAAIQALGEMGVAMPTAPLLTALQAKEGIIRASAVEALGRAGANAPLEALFATLHDTDDVRRHTTEVLKKLQPYITDLTPWLDYLQDPQSTVRQTFIEAFEESIPENLLLKALRDVAWEVRQAAVKALERLGNHAPLEPLLMALRDENKDVRAAAARALGKLGKRTPVPALMEALRNESRQVRRTIIDILKERQLPVPTATLIHLVEHSSLRMEALELAQHLQLPLPADVLLATLSEGKTIGASKAGQLLATMGAEAPVNELLDIVRDTTSPAREEACKTLLNLADYVPTAPVEAILANEPASNVYYYLVQFLLKKQITITPALLLKALEPASLEGTEEDHPAMRKLLANSGEQTYIEALLTAVSEGLSDEWGPDSPAAAFLQAVYTQITPEMLERACQHRISDEIAALKVLGVMQEQAPLDLIQNIMHDEGREWHIRKQARRVLQQSGVTIPLNVLLQEADEKYIDYDREMVKALSRLGTQAPIQELIALLGHPRSVIQKTASEALCELAPYIPVDDLLKALHDRKTPWKSINSIRVCSTLGERAPFEELIALLHSPKENQHIRIAALHALADLHNYVSVETILAVVKDKNQKVRKHCLQVLENWGEQVPTGALLALLKEKHYEPRSEVILALGRLGERTPVELLLEVMESGHANDAPAAIEALSELGELAPVDELLAYLHDEHGTLRPTVLKELGNLGEQAPLDIIVAALDHPERYVVTNAREALETLATTAPRMLLTLSLDNPHVAVRHALMQAVVNLGPGNNNELAIAALSDMDKEVRRLACKALVHSDIDPDLIPLEPLIKPLQEECNVATYYSENQGYGAELRLLAKCGSRVPAEMILPVFGHHHTKSCENAARTLYITHPALFHELVVPQAEAILRGEAVAGVFTARVQSRIADMVRQIGHASSTVLNILGEMLDWPYWEVQSTAAEALGTIHRYVPDRAIHKLLELRLTSPSRSVKAAAENALTSIFTHEGGMEDEVID